MRRILRRVLWSLLGVIVLAVVLFFVFGGEIRRFAYEGFGRDGWQKPEQVLRTLELHPGEGVADIGTGGGYFTFLLARAVGPGGKVYAVDIDAEMVDYVRQRAQREGMSSVETILAEPADPKLPAESVDLIFVCNTYHHLENRADYFRRVARALRPAGRLAVIEFKDSGWLARWFGHGTSAETIRAELESAGYRLAQKHEFLSRQHFLVFSRMNEP